MEYCRVRDWIHWSIFFEDDLNARELVTDEERIELKNKTNLLDMVEYLISSNKNYERLNYLLRLACVTANMDAVKFLLANGADIHYWDDEPLRCCHISSTKCFFCSKGFDISLYEQTETDKNDFREIAKLLLELGANPNKLDNHDNCILQSAINWGDCEMVRLLVSYGADIHFNDIYLFDCAENNDENMLKLLIELGADIHVDDEAPLFSALHYKNFSIIKILLERGANVHARGDIILDFALTDDIENDSIVNKFVFDYDIVKILLENGANVKTEDSAATYLAASNGDIETLKLLISRGASINADNSPLVAAAENNFVEVAKLLLDNVTDVDLDREFALVMACTHMNYDVVKLLLERGVSANSSYGKPLIKASMSNDLDTIELLLENGADIHASDDEAISSALQFKNIEAVKLLLEKGADVNARVKYSGDTLLEESIKYQYYDISRLLLENGADPALIENKLVRKKMLNL